MATAAETRDDESGSDEPDELGRLGAFIRTQRRLAELSQRELARLTDLSDPYVSQIERGLHQPSVRVLTSLAKALNIRADTMLGYAGWIEGLGTDEADRPSTESAIRSDPALSEPQKRAMLTIYESFTAES